MLTEVMENVIVHIMFGYHCCVGLLISQIGRSLSTVAAECFKSMCLVMFHWLGSS